jgi:nucleotide-binding universal stress UspA family protein
VGRILCATRGGEASYRTQDAAITLARERDDELVFLYVVNISFLDTTARAVRPDTVSTELEKMGEFLLLMAQERAKKQGVSASCVIRHGDLREELKAAAREEDIDLVVFGKPAGAASSFTLEDLQDFVTEIEAETGCQTNIL